MLDGDRARELALANLFDGDHATEHVLPDLAREILRAA